MLPEFQKLIESAVKGKTFFKPTDIFNEEFLLKILVQFAIENPEISYRSETANMVLNHSPETKFFCEGQLYTHFRYQLDRELYETDTHGDVVIGDFTILQGTKTRIIVNSNARKFVVIEAKLDARLSTYVKNATFYNQAARNIACIAENLFVARLSPSKLDRIGFYVLVPQQKSNKENFDEFLEPERVKEIVQMRIDQYGQDLQGDLEMWRDQWFLPTMKRITIEKITWEEIIESIIEKFPERTDIDVFYQHCLKNNNLSYTL